MKAQEVKRVDLPEFSRLLSKCREVAGFDIEGLAKEADIGVSVLREWEKGNHLCLTIDSVRSLIRALKLDPAEVEAFLTQAKKDGFIDERYFNVLTRENSKLSVPLEEGDKPEIESKSSPGGIRKISPILEGNVPSLLVSELVPDPDQPRQFFSEESIEELGRSILEHGQMLPAIVLIENGCKLILDGERRWRACKKMWIINIYAIVVESLKIDKFLLSAICNFGREDHTPVDKARAVRKSINIIEAMLKKAEKN